MGPLRPQAPQSRASPLTIPSLTAQSAVKKISICSQNPNARFSQASRGAFLPHGGISEIVCFRSLPLGLFNRNTRNWDFSGMSISFGLAVRSERSGGNTTRPASREARCRAAVKPRPTCFPSSTPAPYGRGVGCRGTAPARPASRGTCRATAVKPRPSRMSPYAPARIARSPKGAQPLGRLVSSRAIRQVCLERSMCLRIRRSKLSRSFCST